MSGLNIAAVAEEYRDSSRLEARIRLHRDFSTNPVNWHRWVLDQLPVDQPGRVLELGCGSGALWLENRERLPDHWQLTLSDISPGMLAQARQALEGITVKFQEASILQLPFEPGSFDLVLANHMLYHIPLAERPLAFAEVRRVLAPGGRFVAATNSRSTMAECQLPRAKAPGLAPHSERWTP